MIANFALTADGKVSTRNFTDTTFTSPSDKRRLKEIRALGDALLVGGRTVAADTMSLGLSAVDLREKRLARGQPAEPLRVIVSNGGTLDPEAKVFHYKSRPPVVFSTRRMPESQRTKLSPLCDLWLFPEKSVPLDSVLNLLHRDYAVRTVICEGGPSLFRALLESGAIDELRLTWCPLVFGGAGAPTLTGLPGDFLKTIRRGRLKKMETIGGECFLTYSLEGAASSAPKPSRRS